MKHNANHATARPNQRKKWPWVLLGIFVLLVALGAALGVTGYKFYKQALQVKDHEMAAVETVKQVKDIEEYDGPGYTAEGHQTDAAAHQRRSYHRAWRPVEVGGHGAGVW